MDKKQAEQLKEVLRSEFLPLFVGLRDELKAIKSGQQELIGKKPPEVQKTEVVNPPEKVTEIGVSNFPAVQRVEITNHPEPIKEVGIANIAPMFATIHESFNEGVKRLVVSIGNLWNDAKANVFDVNVKNIERYPDTIKVSNLAELKQEPTEFPDRIKISNSLPSEAIPVILTDRDRKNFYNAVQQLYFANDVNLDRLIKAVKEVTVDIGEINVDLDDVEALLQEIIDLLEAQEGAGTPKLFFGELSVPASTESILASYLVPVGKTFTIQGVYGEGDDNGIFRVYVDLAKEWQGRNAWTTRDVQNTFARSVPTGATIYLKVLNLKAVARNFSGHFYGNEI